MKLSYDRDWYPVKHRFKGKDIHSSEVGKCFSLTNWKTESKFEPWHIDRLTQTSHLQENRYAGKTFDLTDDLQLVCTRTPVKTRQYKIRDYANDVLDMFDQHMTSLVEQYKGKYVVLSSGGIDGNMCAAWMYKNKIDFEIVAFVNGPRHGAFNNMRATTSLHTWKDKVPTHLFDLDKDKLIKAYILDEGISSVPKTAMNHLDGYDFITNEQCLQHGDWIMHGAGSNHTMLHNGQSVLYAYNSLDSRWKSFDHTSVFGQMTYPGVFRTEYNEWLMGRPLKDYCLHDDWINQDVRWKDHGEWPSYSKIYENRDDKVLTLKNEQWSMLWESIDWSDLDMSLTHEILNATVWREFITKYVGEDVEKETRTGHTGSDLFPINDENAQICKRLLADLRQRFKGNIRLIGEVLASEWLLERYRRLPDQALMLCQMESFLQR